MTGPSPTGPRTRPVAPPERWWRQPSARPAPRGPHRALRRWMLGRSVRLTALLTAAVLARFVWRLAWGGR
jgi:hypothetical protein